MEKGKGGRVTMLRAAAVVLVALCLLHSIGAEGSCVVKNQSKQPVVLVPVVVGGAVEVVVEVGASVEVQAPLQHCYIKNKHSGHRKGPVTLASGGLYVIVDAVVIGEVNLCVGTLLGGILNIGAIVLAGI